MPPILADVPFSPASDTILALVSKGAGTAPARRFVHRTYERPGTATLPNEGGRDPIDEGQGRRGISPRRASQGRAGTPLRDGEEKTGDATYGGNFGAGTPTVPASNPSFARCLTLREGREESMIHMSSF